MPPAISKAFLTPLQVKIARRNEAYNPTDLIDETPRLRFVQGGHLGERWFIWSEHGSMGGSLYSVDTYQLDATDMQPRSRGQLGPVYKQSICNVLTTFLNQREP